MAMKPIPHSRPKELTMLMPDHEIRRRAMQGMIDPFVDVQTPDGVISYGLSSYGYDIRLGYKFKIFDNARRWAGQDSMVVDPKLMNWHEGFTEYEILPNSNLTIRIPPNSFALGESLETINVPRDVLCVCLGKSTLARCGLIVNVTPLEPEWRGKVTIEISNTTPLPARLYPGEGIAQVLFLMPHNQWPGQFLCNVSYADREGRYQDQTGLTMPFINTKEEK